MYNIIFCFELLHVTLRSVLKHKVLLKNLTEPHFSAPIHADHCPSIYRAYVKSWLSQVSNAKLADTMRRPLPLKKADEPGKITSDLPHLARTQLHA